MCPAIPEREEAGGPELPVCREPDTKGLLFRRALCSLQDAALAPSTARAPPTPSSLCYFFRALRPAATAEVRAPE